MENLEVEGQPTQYVFGRLKQRTVAFNFRVNYTLTPNLSIQSYAEPFVSAGDYAGYKELVNGRAPVYTDRYEAYAYARQRRLQHPLVPHDQRASLGISSRLVAVRGVAAEPIGRRRARQLRLQPRFRRRLLGAGHNVFLVKLSYWLNM